MNPEGQKCGGFYFKMTRVQPGSGLPLSIGLHDQIPDTTAIAISALGTWRVMNSPLMYDKFFRFVDFEFELNVFTATHTGEVTTNFQKKELRDESFMFEITAFPIKTIWTIKANLILTIQKKSTGEIFEPHYHFELGDLHQDILGFGVNEKLYREMDIVLNTTIPDLANPLNEPQAPEIIPPMGLNRKIIEIASAEINAMQKAVASFPDQNPDPGGTGELGPIPNAASQPWYIDQTLYEQALASGSLASGIETIFIDSVRQYYQTLNKALNNLWKLEANHTAFQVEYRELVNHKIAYTNCPEGYDYGLWSYSWVETRIRLMIIESLPGFEPPKIYIA